MAGSNRYTAILDANVLYPNLMRDILLSMASVGLYQARWTSRINDEWTRNLVAKKPEISRGCTPKPSKFPALYFGRVGKPVERCFRMFEQSDSVFRTIY